MAVDAQDRHPTGATFYLCAAAYLQPGFADTVLRATVEEKHRAVARSAGTDLDTVVAHCLAARRRRTVHDAALAVTGLVLLAAVELQLLRLVVFCALLAWFFVLTEMTVARYDTVARFGAYTRATSRVPAQAGVDGVPADAPAPASGTRSSNVSVHSGFSPFVGSGFDVGGWSFALNVRRGAEKLEGGRLEPLEFTADELYDAVRRTFRRTAVPHLSMTDELFVHGHDVRRFPDVLPDPVRPPSEVVPRKTVARYRDGRSPGIRHYLVFRVVEWHGELVLSVFVRFRRISENLFIETSYFLLPPLLDRFHEPDRLQPFPTPRETARVVLRSIAATPWRVLRSYPFLVSRALSPVTRWVRYRAERRVIRADAGFDYGALPSVRERCTSTDYRRYFQKLDKEMYTKVLERTLLEAIARFLDAHDVDISALEERRSTILNNGVIVTGGSLTAQNLAAGQGARARSKESGDAKPPGRRAPRQQPALRG